MGVFASRPTFLECHLVDPAFLVLGEPGTGLANPQEHPNINIEMFWVIAVPSIEVTENVFDALKYLGGIDRCRFVFKVLADQLG